MQLAAVLVLVDRFAYSERDIRVSGTSVDTPPKVSRINTSSVNRCGWVVASIVYEVVSLTIANVF